MNDGLISCIIPVFNGERYLAEAVESILKQSYRPTEIIVVDDGSTDGTVAIVHRYKEKVRYLKQENLGPAVARNLGLNAARGSFIAFLDADDLWNLEKLQRQMDRFQSRPELVCSVGHVQNFWISELHGEEEKFRDHRISKPLAGYVCGTLLARRAAFDKVGPFNPALPHGDSTDWFLRAREKNIITELLPDILLYRRLHQTNRIRTMGSSSRTEFLRIVKSIIDRRRQEEP
jgi:glycosyltransferase involved in cell wall biosynthesis